MSPKMEQKFPLLKIYIYIYIYISPLSITQNNDDGRGIIFSWNQVSKWIQFWFRPLSMFHSVLYIKWSKSCAMEIKEVKLF